MLLLENLIMMIGVLISVAFVTLFERKILGYIHIRKGPNKVSVIGLFQPISDAMKLFSKEILVLEMSNYLLYYICAMFGLMLMLMMWIVVPFLGGVFDMNFSLIIFLCFLSMGVYSLLGSGWSSNSSYGLLGGMRSVAQTISYEVSLALILVCLVIMSGSYSIINENLNMIFLIFIYLFILWWYSLLAELNRTPFDFSEGESELVSGFNVEYSGSTFAMIFMAEYGMIIFLSLITSCLFVEMNLMFCIILCGAIILIRGSYPRFRYDMLMNIAWKVILPSSIIIILLNYYFLMMI